MEILLPALDELVQLHTDKIAKFGDMILFTCIKYEKNKYPFFFVSNFIFSSFDDLSEQSIIKRLRKMDTDDDDDNNNLLTVSRNCRPILEHKLVSYFLFSFQYKII